MKILSFTSALAALLLSVVVQAQDNKCLTLDECRSMAIANNKGLEQARISKDMAHYDRAIARANYFPNINAAGTYMYSTMEVNLIDRDLSDILKTAGTRIQGSVDSKIEAIQGLIMSKEQLRQEFAGSPMWQTVMGGISLADISQIINSICGRIDQLLHPDLRNTAAIGVTLVQPVFVGGKIVAYNRIAALAEELAQSKYDTEYQQTVVDVEQAYWQVISVAAKKELAKTYSDFLVTTLHNAELLVKEGVFTESNYLAVKVKSNEADMMLTQATNGLVLSKMLLCKLIGLPLDSQITLADERIDQIPVPSAHQTKSMEQVINDRPELRSLNSAVKIYDQKVKVARSAMLPTVAINASWMTTNPSMIDGFHNRFSGFFNAGVMVKIPVFHGFEALNKTRKAKAEAALYRSKYEDTKNLINLELTQLYSRRREALDRLVMSQSDLECAEENLRMAMLGFEEGVMESNVTLAAQAAWLKAHSQCIDAGIELQMIESNLNRAEGNIYKHE